MFMDDEVHTIFDTASTVCGAGSMQRSDVRLSVLSIDRSTAACGWFAAERRLGSSTSSLLPHVAGIPTTLVTPLLISSAIKVESQLV